MLLSGFNGSGIEARASGTSVEIGVNGDRGALNLVKRGHWDFALSQATLCECERVREYCDPSCFGVIFPLRTFPASTEKQ